MKNEVQFKFDQDGHAIPYYGNTIISFLNTFRYRIFSESIKVWERMRKAGFAKRLAFLPPSSFHMTVLSLCREIDRGTDRWPSGVPDDAKFAEIDACLKERVERIPYPEEIWMEPEICEAHRIVLCPADEESGRKLKDYRDTVSAATGIRHPGHDTFRYHISLAYRLQEFSQEEKQEEEAISKELTEVIKKRVAPFCIPAPQFVIFNDMMSYEPDLSKRGKLY